MKEKIFSIVLIFLLVPVSGPAVPEVSQVQRTRSVYTVSGLVVFFSSSRLRVARPAGKRTRHIYSFKITRDTRIEGMVYKGAFVTVEYTRRRLKTGRYKKTALVIRSMSVK